MFIVLYMMLNIAPRLFRQAFQLPCKPKIGQRHLYPDEIKLIKEILGVEYNDIFM